MRINENHWLINTPIAHRGLWSEDVVENSLTAYKKAVDTGYPIEIDLYLTKDDVLVSFHDSSLIRMTGVEGNVFDKTLSELKELRLSGTLEQIPTFDEVLETVNGKVPLLIEIKKQPNKKVVDKIVERLKTYNGEFALQSFNPFYMKRVKQLAPEFIRGILANPVYTNKKNLLFYWVVRKMPFNFLIKPDFLSIYHAGLPLKKSKIKNCRVITWTITDKTTADKIKTFAENIIFENFKP